MLGWRILISLFLVPSLIGLFWLDAASGPRALILLCFCLLAAARNCYELTGLLRTRSMRPSFSLTLVCSLLTILAAWGHVISSGEDEPVGLLTSLGWICSAMTLSFLLLLIREAIVYEEPGQSMESLGCNLLTVFYAGGLLAVTAQFRWFPDTRLAYFAIGSMIISVKCGDIGAYTFGRLWGKRRMAPKLSPGKTWMGFAGALFGSMLGGGLWLQFGGALFNAHPTPGTLPVVLSYCLCMGIIGLTGDLCESLIKRDVQKKDAAALMPGFGGLLDLLDSPLFAGPVALAWWSFLPPASVLQP
jgi:phosphatidate cytidylyltransferase